MTAATAKNPKWVLIVDDEGELRDLLAEYFELQFGEKLKIVTAADGIEATSKIRFQAYDCIVTDLRMPRREGRAFIESVNQTPLNQHTPVIVHTAFPDEELLQKFPMCTLLQKPVTPERMIEVVEVQLKLGRTDRRVGAHILNKMIEASHQILEKFFGTKGETLAPKLKRKGDPVQGDMLRIVSFKMGPQVADFLFTFSKSLIAQMEQVATKGQVGHDPEQLLKAAASIIVNSTTKMLDGQAVGLQRSTTLLASRDAEEWRELSKRKGILIPIGTPHGEMEIVALT